MAVYKRGRIYWVRFNFKGKSINHSAHTTNKRDAEEYEAKLREECNRLRRGGKPRLLFDEAVKKYLKEYPASSGMKQSTLSRYMTSFIAIAEDFTGKYLDEITRTDVINCVNRRIGGGVTPSTVRKDFTPCSGMYTYFQSLELVEHNPFKGVTKRYLKPSKPKLRFLTTEEYSRLLSVCTPYLKPIIICLVNTGLRKEELLSLEWKDVNFTTGEIYLSKTKTDSPRVIPIPKPALEQILLQKRRAKNPYVFSANETQRYSDKEHGCVSIKKAWQLSRKRAKIEDVRLHDLRHTFASWSLKGQHAWQTKPMDLSRLQKWLGHKNIQMTMVYSHLCVEDLHNENTGANVDTGAWVYNLKEVANDA